MKFAQRGAEPRADQDTQRGPRPEHCIRVDVAAELAGDVGFRGQSDCLGDKRRIELRVGEDCSQHPDEAVIFAWRAPGPPSLDADKELRGRERLHRLPAVERIGVARGEEAQVLG